MSIRAANLLGIKLLQEVPKSFLSPVIINVNHQSVRHRRTKHWDPKWKLLRRLKVMKVDLPNWHEKEDELSEEEMRSRLKERGILPPRPWIETAFHVSCTGGVFEGYIPPEGDGKVSPITAQGAKQKLQFLEKKSKTMMAIRKIRQFEEDFDTPTFCKLAEEIYIKSHECMISRDSEKVQQYVTERAHPEIMHNIENKTIHWKYLKTLELPRVVHARCTDVITKENIFAQLTVRFHSQQVLAIYDRFGRLMHGSEIIAKDVLEYVVFEKHMANEYGTWRIHEKIIPDWLPPKEPSPVTYKKLKKIEAVAETAVVQTSSDEKKIKTLESVESKQDEKKQIEAGP